MSDTTTRDRPAKTDEPDIEARARLMGWRPLEEFRGPAGAWKSAEEFVRRGEEDLPLVREHNRKLEQRLLATERKLTESSETLEYVSGMMRSSEERAFKRAKAELEAQRRTAVASGDTAAFEAAEREMQQLEKEAPKPPPARPTPPAAGDVAPEALAWADRNPWFKTDTLLNREAQVVHSRLLQTEPSLTLTQNLERTTRTIKAMFPERFQTPEDSGHLVDDNPRRQQASTVAASSGGGGPARPKPRSFDAMPAQSKEAFTKYSTQLQGKGKPLTKEEWAETYWSQFGDE